MINESNPGQINFEANLSALSQFIQRLQEFSTQSSGTGNEVKELTRLFKDLNTMIITLNSSFTSLKASSEVTQNFNNIITVVSQLQASFARLGEGAAGLETFSNQIRALSGVITQVTKLSNSFGVALSTIGQSGPQFNQLATALDTVQAGFKQLMAVSTEFQNLNAFINQLIDSFNKLITLTSRFDQLLKSTSKVADNAQIEMYFKEIIVLVERLNASFAGLSNAAAPLAQVSTGLQHLNQTITSLLTITKNFNTVLATIGQTPITGDLNAQFSQMLTMISNLNQSFQSIIGTSDNLSVIATQFKEISTVLSGLVKLSNQLSRTLEVASKVPSLNVLEGQFVNLIQVITRMDASFKQLSGADENIRNITATVTELSTAINSIRDLSMAIGGPEDFARIQASMTTVLTIIRTLVTEINAMPIDQKKFTQLNDIFRNLSATVKELTASQNQLNRANAATRTSLSHLDNSVNRTQGAFGGFFNSFNRAGRNPINWLNTMHMGVNELRFGIQGLAMAMGGRQIWDFLIGTNQRIEVLQQSMAVTMKSAEDAAETIRMLRSYAALTPFYELETFRAGEMLAANRMDVERWIKIAGDLASAKRTAGVQLDDVINVLTRINAGDFGRAMIRLRQMGISLNDLKAQGLEFTRNNTFLGTTDEMLNALEQIINNWFGGLTQQLGQTVEGLISTVRDFFYQLGIELGAELFVDLKVFLKDVRDDLREFQNSLDFKQLVRDFNYFVERIGKGLGPWISAIQGLFAFILTNLPVIANMIEVALRVAYFHVIVSVVKSIVSTLFTLVQNWAAIGVLVHNQNEVLASNNVILTKTHLLLAKIIALKKLGLQLVTEEAQVLQTASATTAGALLTVGGRQAATGAAVGAKDWTAGNIVAGSKSEAIARDGITTALAGTALGAVKSKLGTTLEAVLAVVSGLGKVILVIGVITGLFGIIAGLFRGSGGQDPGKMTLDRRVYDWERMTGAQNEEVESLQRLNSARRYTNQQLDYYNQLVQQNVVNLQSARAANDGSTEAIENEKNAAAQLANAQDALNQTRERGISLNDQIMDLAPELSAALTDEVGRLTDSTGGFDENTRAIEDNIRRRQELMDQNYSMMIDAAGIEAQNAQWEIDNLTEIQRRARERREQDPTSKFFGGVWGFISRMWASESEQERINRAFELGNIEDPEHFEHRLAELDHIKFEQREIIRRNEELQREPQQLIEQGWFRRNPDGTPILDNQGQRIPDPWAQQRNEELQRRYGEVDQFDRNPYTHIDEILRGTKDDVTAITLPYQIQLEEILARNMGDNTTAEYQQVQDRMFEQVAAYYNDQVQEFEYLEERNRIKTDELIAQAMDPNVRDLLKAGIGFDDFMNAVELIRNGQADLVNSELSRFLDQLSEMAQTPNLEVYSADFARMELQLEVADRIRQAQLEMELGRAQALADRNKQSRQAQADTAYEIFKEELSDAQSMKELQRDVLLQQKEISGFGEESPVYQAHKRQQNLTIRDFLLGRMQELQSMLTAGRFQDIDERRDMEIHLLKLQKEANSLLLDIKENTQNLAEFNKPNFVRAITYYDYRARDAATTTLTIGDAKFVMQIEAPQTLDDVQTIMDVVKKYFGNFIKQQDASGYVNPQALR